LVKSISAIRLLLSFERSEDPADPAMNRVLAAAARYSLPVNVLCWGRLDQAKAPDHPQSQHYNRD
jgi:L-fuconolactonase